MKEKERQEKELANTQAELLRTREDCARTVTRNRQREVELAQLK